LDLRLAADHLKKYLNENSNQSEVNV